MSSAYSITAAVNPPRAVYLDFPLGHTAGKVGDKALQRRVMIDTLSALDGILAPGTIRELSYEWSSDDGWKDHAMRPKQGSGPSDDRVERHDIPQYQTVGDRDAAQAELAAGDCPGCVWLSDEPRS
jgi:hypothetical protein